MTSNCNQGVYNKVLSLFATVTFQKVLNGESSIELLFAAQTALLKSRIPYQLTYTIGTPSQAASANLMIYITPIWTMSFVFTFQAGDPAALPTG